VASAHRSMGFCGVAGGVPSVNEPEWGPLFADSHINWFWNWDVKVHKSQYVPKGWKFVPNLWGPDGQAVKPGRHPHSGPGAKSYEIVDMLLGWNEPDIVGMCISQPKILTPDDGWCASAGSMGWWFPDVIKSPTIKMHEWYSQFDDAAKKGYAMATPMVAEGTGSAWLRPFVAKSCHAGRCPKFLSWHFYSMGCHDEDKYLDGFIAKLDDSLTLMHEHQGIEGVLITEAGTLALEHDGSKAAETCSNHILVAVMRKMFAIMRRSKYFINGKHIVKHFSWFSEDGYGATYNLALVDPGTGALRPLGRTYAEECAKMEGKNIVV